jgi:hypothetical protein
MHPRLLGELPSPSKLTISVSVERTLSVCADFLVRSTLALVPGMEQENGIRFLLR